MDTRDNLQLYPDTGKYATPNTGTSHCEVNLGTILNRPSADVMTKLIPILVSKPVLETSGIQIRN